MRRRFEGFTERKNLLVSTTIKERGVCYEIRKKSVVALGVLSLVLSLHHVESFAKPFVKKASKKVEKTVTITSKKDLTKKFNKNLLKLKGKFTLKLSTSVVKNEKALVKVLNAGVKKDAGATVVYKFTKNKKPSVKKIGQFLLVKFNMKYDKKRISKALALAYEKGFIDTKVTRRKTKSIFMERRR